MFGSSSFTAGPMPQFQEARAAGELHGKAYGDVHIPATPSAVFADAGATSAFIETAVASFRQEAERMKAAGTPADQADAWLAQASGHLSMRVSQIHRLSRPRNILLEY